MRRLAIAFFFDEFGIVDDYMLHLVVEIGKFVERTIFVSNGPLSKQSVDAVKSVAEELLIRENTEFDVGGYKAALRSVGYQTLSSYDEIFLYNHTFYGPIFPLSEMFYAMERLRCDFWGITDHREVTPNPFTNSGTLYRHIQSHFIAVRKRLLESELFRLYWESIPQITNYVDSILLHETVFTKYFEEHGYKSQVYISEADYADTNPGFINVDETLENRCPILKRRVFFHDPVYHDEHAIDLPRALRIIREKSNYDTELIWRNICRSAELRTLNVNAARTSIFPDLRLKQSSVFPEIGNVAVCAHIYYVDMAEELLRLAHNIPVTFDLIVTTDTEDKKTEIQRLAAQSKRIKNPIIRVVDNRGRDTSALFFGCRDLFLDNRYDLVCRLHSKKSPQDGASRSRSFTRHLEDNLLNSPGYVSNVLDMFADNPSIGVAIPPIVHISYPTLGHSWFNNRKKVEEIAHLLNMNIHLDANTPVAALGGMYWFRPGALRKLFEHEWDWEDFERETYGDGDLPHALERLICYAAQDARYVTEHIMCMHQAERNYASLEFKLHQICSFIPAGYFRSQCSLLMQWMNAGHPLGQQIIHDAGPDQAGALPDKGTGPKPGLQRKSLLARLTRKRPKISVITLADRARDAGQWEVAAGYYRDALYRRPNNPPIWVQYGHALKEVGRLIEAERAYRTAVAYDQRIADSHLQMGRVLKLQSKKEEALASCLRAFALDSSQNGVYSELVQLGWSEAHLSELRRMLDTGV